MDRNTGQDGIREHQVEIVAGGNLVSDSGSAAKRVTRKTARVLGGRVMDRRWRDFDRRRAGTTTAVRVFLSLGLHPVSQLHEHTRARSTRLAFVPSSSLLESSPPPFLVFFDLWGVSKPWRTASLMGSNAMISSRLGPRLDLIQRALRDTLEPG